MSSPSETDRSAIVSRDRRRPLVQTVAVARKELAAVVRQPRLLLMLVIGPFLLLFLFGVGYDQESTVLRTQFVGPDESIYQPAIDRFADELQRYVVDEGYTNDLVDAQRRLDDGEIDLIVALPADPAETVLDGRQASITILHDKLDPIQQTAVEVSAQVAVQELNSIVLERVVGELQTEFVPYQNKLVDANRIVAELDSAVAAGDEERIAELTAELQAVTGDLATVVDTTEAVTVQLGGDVSQEEQQELDELGASLDELQQTSDELALEGADRLTERDVDRLRTQLGVAEDKGELAATIDPAIIVRPFAADTENLLREPVRPNDFFAPAAIALLVQHMALTFAAIGLVGDRARGLFELFRVAPIGAGSVLTGKYAAHLLLGSIVSALLLTGVVALLGVPMRGQISWVAVGIFGLVSASVAWGMVLSLIARTDSQAVQYAMLALLAGLFFGGFLLDLDAIRYPVKAISFLLPVTYGTRLLRDTMLRGDDPALLDLVGLGTTAVVMGALASFLLSRQLRPQ